MRSRVGRAFAMLGSTAVALTVAGCRIDRPAASGESRVKHGKLYQSDNPTYDDFFESVHAVQSTASDALDDEAKARAPLERAMGTRNTTPERLVELTKERVKRGREGPPLHVVVTGLDLEKQGEKPKDVVATVTVPDEAAVPSNQRDIVKALDESAKSEAEIATHFESIVLQARRLSARQAQLLASLSRDFTTPSRRDEVSRELGDAKPVLDGVAERAEKASNSARSFLKGMALAFPSSSDASPVARDDKLASGKSPDKSKKPAPTSPSPKSAKQSPAPQPAPPARSKPAAAPKLPSEVRSPKPAPQAPAPRSEPVPAPPPPQAKAPSEDFNP